MQQGRSEAIKALPTLKNESPVPGTSLRNTSNTDWGMRKGPRTTLYA